MDFRGTLLTIAGFDPSSGAGITADLAVFATHGFFGVSAITALTVQSTLGVRAAQPVAPEWLAETLACLHADLPAAGVKIGMLGATGNVRAVADFLTRVPASVPVVLDPVMVASSGRPLLTDDGLEALRQELLPHVTWATPNRAELARLTGSPVASREQVESASAQFARRFPRLNLVITGGDFDPPDDLVLLSGQQPHWLPGVHIPSNSTHGTGCAFSSALLCRLSDTDRVQSLEQVSLAKQFVSEAIRTAQPLGHGRGPINLRATGDAS